MTKEQFTQITSNWDSHRPLLWEALEATKHLRLPVMELGAGFGSTPFLTEYCDDNGLELYSYDSKKEWCEKLKDYPHVTYVENWDRLPHSINAWINAYSVVLVDEAPGEHRKISIKQLSQGAKIIVAHDTEPAADHGYKMRAELKKFKYLIDYETSGAWATAVSNYIDVTLFNL